MTRRTATLNPAQPSLFDPEPKPTTPPAPPRPATKKIEKRRNRHHTLDLPRPWTKHQPCAPVCLVCGRPEELGACAGGCATICGRPDRTGPIEVCLLTKLVPARRAPGRDWALVTCPHCHKLHWHRPTEGRAYRIGQCGHPYLVRTEPT